MKGLWVFEQKRLLHFLRQPFRSYGVRALPLVFSIRCDPAASTGLHFLLDVSDIFLDITGLHAAGVVGSDRFVCLQGFVQIA